MSDILMLHPSPLPDETTAKSAPRSSFRAMIRSALESLVEAQRNRFDDNDRSFYRFPPF
jgi:hypothetical protein